MKNLLSILLLLSIYTSTYSQKNLSLDSQRSVEIPTVLPPSPTVASLMKYEEVPVNNYTGIPDISAPIFQTKGPHNFELKISLNYHPLVKKNDIAGYTGLGWSLFAGGTISRTVRDLPDEYVCSAGNCAKEKYGIFSPSNPFYSVAPLLQTYDSTNPTNPVINEFLWEASEKQKYDAKHDLYQYNFFGKSGRFIVEKTGNSYIVVKLDVNNDVINFNFDTKVFEIIDNQGFRYVFDILENSINNTDVLNTYLDGVSVEDLDVDDNMQYISAFHLSKIYFDDQIVAEFYYDTFTEVTRTVNSTYNVIKDKYVESAFTEFVNSVNVSVTQTILPHTVSNVNITTTQTKKIKEIKVNNNAIISFTNLVGRNDYKLVNSVSAPYLKAITIKNWNQEVVKSYNFEYNFLSKLFLYKISQTSNPANPLDYKFDYNNKESNPEDYFSDYWGFYGNLKSNDICSSPDISNNNKVVNGNNIVKDVLKSMTYPTGGHTAFEFESNTFAHIGQAPILTTGLEPTFYDNTDNWIVTDLPTVSLSSNNNTLYDFGVTPSEKIMIITPIDLVVEPGTLFLKKTNGATTESIGLNFNCPTEFVFEAGYFYSIIFGWLDINSIGTVTIELKEKKKNPNISKWLYGGGIRIRSISFSPDNADLYFKKIAKKIRYDYNFFDEPDKSSGSLVYPIPAYAYEISRRAKIPTVPCVFNFFEFYKVDYIVTTELNNLNAIVTKGSDVGYKNVTVYQENEQTPRFSNGKSQYVYTSPIDYPVELNSRAVVYPFAPSADNDFKRGLLLKESLWNLSSKLQETTNTYQFTEFNKMTGLTLFYENLDCPWANYFLNYASYKSSISSSSCISSLICQNTKVCGSDASSYIYHYPITEKFGLAQRITEEKKDFFYKGIQKDSLTTLKSIQYNPINKQISRETVNNSNNEIFGTSFEYSVDGSTALYASNLTADNRITTPLIIKTFLGTVQLSEQKNQYLKNNSTNNFVKLNSVSLNKDITQSSTFPDKKIKYNLYDLYGNVLEIQQDDGIAISYIWGYNQTLPVAKLENIALANIPSALITAIQTVSDAPTSTEAQVISALNALRTSTDVNLQKAMVTTYTHKPLIGVSTITDPKGDKITYSYDAFGRLQNVKDKDGNILSENEYHYKN